MKQRHEWIPLTGLSGLISAAIVSASVLHSGTLYAQAPDSTIQAVTTIQLHDMSDIDRAIRECESLIEKYPQSDFTPTVMFQLMELYYRKASEEYQARMEAYEAELAKFEAGEISFEPTIPRISYNKVFQVGNRLLEEFPTADFIDKVIYRMAICYLQERNYERAIEYFTKLAEEYTYSTYYDEANFRLGEQYFDQRNYDEAIKYYSRLMDRWDSPFFDMALYKLGWSYFNQDNYSKSISTFIFLIDDLNRLDKSEQNLLGKTTADLRKDAMAYVAESFAELGGAKQLEKFLKEIGEKEYAQSLFLKMAEIFQKRNFYDESNETYATILKLWPLYEKAPEVQAQIIENYMKIEDFEAAEKARETLVKNYGPGSEWLRRHPEGEAREKALELAETNLYILATDAQARAMETKSARDFSLAIARYQDFLEKFPESELAPKVQFYQAECYFEMGDYLNASKAYEQVVLNYPDHELATQAAYNRVVAALNLIQEANGVANDTSTIYIKDFLGTGEMKAVRIPNKHYQEFFNASNDFARFYPDAEKLPEVLMKFGETLFNLDYFDLAQSAYLMVINKRPDSSHTLRAYSMVAQSAFKQEDYVSAEKWYSRIIEEYPDSTRYVQKAQTMIASAKFKLAEQLKAKGELDYAAKAFENIAANTQNEGIAERALLEAALQYEKAGEKTRAIILYENLPDRFPKSSKVDEALFKAAALSEELPDYNRAAANYLRLVDLSPTSIYAAKALYNAAVCYENLQDYDRAAQVYERYVATYRDDPNRYIDALSKIGLFAFEQQDFARAQVYFLRVLESYHQFIREGKSVDEYPVAEAQFKIAEIYFDEYKKIELVEPLAKNLKRKRKLFEQVVLACQNAAKYKVADWTTAALFRIGAAYEEFSRAFLESPRPKGLTPEMLAKYEENLQKKVLPLKKKALETYRQNLKLAEENNLQNNWIQLTRERAEKLTLELGLVKAEPEQPPHAKTELTEKSTPDEE